MAEFCEACAKELGHPYSDFKGIAKPGEVVIVLCEGCGLIQVNSTGRCTFNHCLKTGKPGHGRIEPKHEDGPLVVKEVS